MNVTKSEIPDVGYGEALGTAMDMGFSFFRENGQFVPIDTATSDFMDLYRTGKSSCTLATILHASTQSTLDLAQRTITIRIPLQSEDIITGCNIGTEDCLIVPSKKLGSVPIDRLILQGNTEFANLIFAE